MNSTSFLELSIEMQRPPWTWSRTVMCEEVHLVALSLTLNKAPGPDKVSACIIKDFLPCHLKPSVCDHKLLHSYQYICICISISAPIMAATFRVALVSITILSCLSAAFLNHLLSFEATFKSRWEPLHTAVQLKKKCTCIVKDGFHRSRVPMQKHTKHGFVSLVIPGHDPPLDIACYF